MSFQDFSPSSFLSLLCFMFMILVKIQLSLTCNHEPFSCGNVTADYPFWRNGEPREFAHFCGHPELMLTCEEGDDGKVTMMIKEIKYQVLDVIVEKQLLKIARDDYLWGICPPKLQNTTSNSELFDYSSTQNLTLLYCMGPFGQCSQEDAIYVDGIIHKKSEPHRQCNGHNEIVEVLVPKATPPAEKLNQSALEAALRQGFEVNWTLGGFDCLKCRKSNGFCGFKPVHFDGKWKPVCYCPTEEDRLHECPRGTHLNS